MTSLTSSQPPHHHTPKYTGYHRQWFSVLPSETQPVNSQFSSTTEPISVLSYNLLAQSLCNRRGTQCYLTPEQARWSFRKTKLLNEIAHLNMDIISLQEVDFYDTFWEMELQKLGYSTVFSPQFNFEKNYRPMPYGLVIGYKKDKFNLLKFKVVDYRLQALSMSKFDVNHESSCCNETSHSTSILPPMTVLEQCEMNQSGNIALLAVLQCNNDPNCGVILSNTHLYWRPESNVVRVRQELVLLHEMNELFKDFNKNDRNDLFELVFTGDFNTSPNDLPYILLTTRNPESNNGCDENGIALDENGKKFWNAFNQSEMMSGLDGYDCEQDPLVPYFPIVEWATDQCKEEFLQQQSHVSMTSTSNSSDESLNVQEQYFFEQFYMDQKVKRLEHIRQCVKHFSHFPLLHSLYTQYSKCSTLTFMKEEERQRQVLNPTICNTTTLTIQDRIEAMKVHSRWSNQELYYTTFTPKYISSLDYIMVRKRAIVPTMTIRAVIVHPSPSNYVVCYPYQHLKKSHKEEKCREVHVLDGEGDSEIPKAFCLAREEELRRRVTHSLEFKKAKKKPFVPMHRTNSSPVEIVKPFYERPLQAEKRSRSMPYRVIPVNSEEEELGQIGAWEGSVRVITSPPVRRGSRKSITTEVAIVITPPCSPAQCDHLSPSSRRHLSQLSLEKSLGPILNKELTSPKCSAWNSGSVIQTQTVLT
ncbi:hypothetical protein C9374_000091 [Naegleria lovaniensis]|uniref:Endonuclease/exonuclease/phosphatase domain-containing protein n=1 Tax=Naegleria lovaniensis TaxID=51637 RepID=A0AA88GX25_NAELO|nr:uncharacterized protein C9374_000091 [Naegleria lovaniensis]KAG2388652.1 hypothetical protein C9374_000091 [Naegleria lovaniensis]